MIKKEAVAIMKSTPTLRLPNNQKYSKWTRPSPSPNKKWRLLFPL